MCIRDRYTVKRLLQSVLTVLIIATLVFLMMRMLPNEYYFSEEQLMKLTDEQKEDILTAAGLNDPITVSYTHLRSRKF